MNRRQQSILLLSRLIETSAKLLVPIMPLVLLVLLHDRKYIRQYATWIGKLRVHVQELCQGPIRHYLTDVLMRHQNIPVHIQGECVQCGNCCLNKKCAFLVAVEEEKYQCGIYNSFLRKFSNCNSFPLHAQDIERYSCPSYTVVSIFPARTSQPVPDGECNPGFVRGQAN